MLAIPVFITNHAEDATVRNFSEFVESLRIEDFLYRPMTPITLSQIDAVIASGFAESECCGEILMPFDGMQMIGARAYFGENSVNIRWKSKFFPAPRFAGQSGGCQPLGFFGEFDLYIGTQYPLPPTLIARYGNQPSDYLIYNPSWQGLGSIFDAGEHFVEALHRAQFINFDLQLTGTDH